MRNITMLLLLIGSAFYFTGCKKIKEEVVLNDGLTGKWQLVRSAIGTGGGFAYNYPDPSKPEIIEFKGDSSFSANANAIYFSSYNTYSLVNTRDIKFSPPLFSNPPDTWGYQTIDGTTLRLYMYIGCIEGCFDEYKAIK